MRTNFDEIKLLFEKVELINFKYKEILNTHDYDFNIFSILRNDNDEVNLHSRFLFEILNPDGSHYKGKKFLKLFLNHINITDFNTSNDNILIKKEYQNIDICITNDTQAIIIENKIFAGDQSKQLERYFEIIKQEGFEDIRIIYLSLYGEEPSEQSIGLLKNEKDDLIIPISYKEDIDKWIELCIKEVAGFPFLRETLTQYQILVQKLTGKHHSRGYIMEIKNLLMDENTIGIATDIGQALIESKIEIQFAFWENLSSALESLNYNVITSEISSRDTVESYYYKSKNNKYYGIDFNLFNIDKSEKLLFRIEIDWNIYYGFYVDRDSKDYNYHLESKYNSLAEIIKKIDANFTRSEYWLGWRHPNRKFDFRSFNDKNLFALANPSKRKTSHFFNT